MSDKKPATKKAKSQKDEPKVTVRILKHRTKVGSMICAVGAKMQVTKAQADILKSENLAEVIGV